MKIPKKLYVERSAIIAGGIFFIFSLNHIFSLYSLQGAAYGVGEFGYNIWSLLGFIVSIWLLKRLFRRKDRRLHCVAAVSGLLMAAVIVYGTYVHFVNDIFQSARVVCLQLILTLGIAVAAIPVSEEILLQFDRLNHYGARKWEGKVSKSYFFIVWLLIFAAYIPIFLWSWPGNFVYDAPFQLIQVIDHQYNTHHPLLHTVMMGAAYQLGVRAGDASTGFQFYTLLQMLILSASFAYCAYYLYKRRVPRVYRVCAVLWFALFPMHAMFSITATKDTLFAAFFLWFMIYMVRLLFDREQFRWYHFAGLAVSCILCCLMRNNAIYAVIAGSVILLWIVKKNMRYKLYMAGFLAGICILTNLANAGLTAATNAETVDRYRETFCMALQCLARVAAYRRNDISETDYREICAYMPEEDIKVYSPYLADAVKSNANEELMKENFINFMKLFVKIGLRFPDEYLEAWIAGNLGYWYPLDRGMYVTGSLEFYHKLMWREHEIIKREYCSWPRVIYEPLYYYGDYTEVPVLGYLHRPDCWVWLLNYFLFWCIYRKKKGAGLTGIIPLMYLATCYLGPTAILRYIYCLVVMAPLLGYVVMQSADEQAYPASGKIEIS